MRASIVLVVGLSSAARADPLAMRESGAHDTEATITVDATPAEVYAAITSYHRWPARLQLTTHHY